MCPLFADSRSVRVMFHSLRVEKLANCCKCFRVGRLDSHFSAARQVGIRVADGAAFRSHGCSSRHVAHVYKRGSGEVASLERVLNELEMCSYLGDSKRVDGIPLELDAPAIRCHFEVMAGSVLIDAHGHLPPLLHRCKGSIGRIVPCRFRRRRAPREEQRREKDRDRSSWHLVPRFEVAFVLAHTNHTPHNQPPLLAMAQGGFVMILVAGATGNLGAEIVTRLRKMANKCVAWCASPLLQRKSRASRQSGAEAFTGNLRDMDSLEQACRGVSTVISTVSIVQTAQPGDSFEDTDAAGTISLIEAAKIGGSRPLHLHLVRCGAVSRHAAYRREAAVEKHLKKGGIDYTILQPPPFMESWLGPISSAIR